MTGNYCTSTTGGSGACIMQAPSGTNVKTTLGGTFEAYGNYVNGNGSVIHGASTGSVIHLEGRPACTTTPPPPIIKAVPSIATDPP